MYMWAKLGIDSGVFSRALMDTSKRAVQAGTADVLNGEDRQLVFDHIVLQCCAAGTHSMHGDCRASLPSALVEAPSCAATWA